MKKIKAHIRRNVFDAKRSWLSLVVLLVGACACGAVLLIDNRANAVVMPETIADNRTGGLFEPESMPALIAAQDWSVFHHERGEHKENCNSCHARNSNAVAPTLPGHEACIKCHGAQFVTMGSADADAPETKMCYICHTNLSSPHTIKTFSRLQTRGQSFNMKFTHAQHTAGAGRPASGCVFCHRVAGRAAFSIPARLNAHAGCYTCHTPGKEFDGRDIGSCGTCHAQAGYSRATTNAKSFAVGFSHGDHGARQRLSCNDCHSVRNGVAQKLQVSSPVGEQHFANARAQNCLTCHNGRRAFGGDNFTSCARCHKGATFSLSGRR